MAHGREGDQDGCVRVERRAAERFAVVTLDRPEKLNAGGPAMFAMLVGAMRELDDDPDVRAVVLTGAGTRSFCAGADLGEMRLDDVGACADWIRFGIAPCETIENMRTPVIAAVNGYAFGFGLELVMACDLVLAAASATFALKEIDYGVIGPTTLTRGVDVIGRRRAAWLAMTGAVLDAHEAVAFGFVNEVVAPEDLPAAAADLARKLAGRGPLALAAAKRLLNAAAGPDYRQCESVMPALLISEDAHEGSAAFAERRAPEFRGR